MNQNLLETKFICQIAVVVRDAAKASSRFAQLLGVPAPDIILANEDGSDTVVLRGEPTRGRVRLAFFHMDNLDWEFIEPTEDPSTWKEFLETNGPGVHHVAFKAKNRMMETAQKIEEFGFPLLQYGDKSAYLDSQEDLGVLLELLDID